MTMTIRPLAVRVGRGLARRAERAASRVPLTWRHRDEPPTFVGSTRYSVLQPDSGSWKLSRGAKGRRAYQEMLWAPERMNPRARIFLEFGVPILQQMADKHDYTHIVQYSDTMPEPWLGQLRAAAERYPVLWLVEASTRPDLVQLVHQVARRSTRGSRPMVQFRLDDDDLLSIDYLDRLADLVTKADTGRAVSLASGYTGFLRDDALVGPVRNIRMVFGSQGLAYVGWYDRTEDRVEITLGGKHYQVDRKMPTVVDSRAPAFFQMKHIGQDTVFDANRAEEVIQAKLDRLPVLASAAQVEKSFPTLAPLLRSRS